MGEVFAGRYELADPIGRGGVGAVWRAWDHRRRRYVAAKVLQQRDAHSLLRFVREQALRIDHPHVLAPASWAADDDKVLFTMDLVAGGSLVHLVGDYGPLPPAFVCVLLDQLLSGLAAVHAEGVVHRDIKPANVLLEATGTGHPRLRLSDFGIAMRLGEPRLTETNLVVGTPGYLAPEQMLGAEPDFPADLFATGLVALYLLQGAKPDAKALVEYFAEHGTPSAAKGVPEPLWQVVAALLQPDPDARFRTATGARKALAAAIELLPEPGPDDELIEIFDQLGPLPPGFGSEGPLRRGPGVTVRGGEAARGVVDGGGEVTGTGSGGAYTDAPGGGTASGGASAVWSATGGNGTPGGGAGGFDGTGAFRRLDDSVGSDPRHGFRQDTGPTEAAADRTDSPDPSSSPGAPGLPSPLDPSLPLDTSLPFDPSDTGGFHLPPPQAALPPAQHATPPLPAVPPPAPRPAATPATGVPLRPVAPAPAPRPHGDEASTASYTAEDPRPSVPGRPSAPGRAASRHRAARPRRPGPPARAVVPLLLLALACYAVGFWALSRL
ncbi:serine/threonine-protein kinase [Streptomyces seoulensis]